MDTLIKIRAHHLLCMQGFQGYGYDGDFVVHLNSVIATLRSDPTISVQIIIGCDDICVCCPHCIENRCQKDCDSDAQINLMDSNVLDCIGIQQGCISMYQELINQVNDSIKTKVELANICGDCQWTDKCLWYLSLDLTCPLTPHKVANSAQ